MSPAAVPASRHPGGLIEFKPHGDLEATLMGWYSARLCPGTGQPSQWLARPQFADAAELAAEGVPS